MNYFYKLRYSFYTFFGIVPGAEKIEAKREKTARDLRQLDEIGSSDKLKRYQELEQFIHSGDFKERKKSIEAQKYKGTEAYNKEKRYKKLAGSGDIKTYYKVKDSQDLRFFNEFKDSEKLKKYTEARDYFTSQQFKQDRDKIKKERKEKLGELKAKKKEYQTLRKKYRWYEKLINDARFNDFLHFKDAETFQQYLDLENETRNLSLKDVKSRYQANQKKLKKEKKQLEKRYKQLEKEARKANKKKQPFQNEQELERIKETLSSGKYDQMIKDADYRQAPEYVKLKQYKDLRKNKRVKQAAAYYHSKNYQKYLETVGSDELKHYEELKNYINNRYKQDLKEAKALTYKNSDIYKQHGEYKQLKKDKDIKRYNKFVQSKRYKIYSKLNNSELIKEYEELHEYVNSKDFLDYKKYMKNPKKFKLSDEYQQLQEYKKLKKDKDLKWYFKNKDNKELARLRAWESTFEDTFDSSELDTGKWDTLPFPAKKFISGTYSQWNDEQLYAEEGNHHINNSVLKIETRKEEREGKAWHPTMGFLPRKFNYTSAMLNTGDKFLQQYGIFEAKIRMGYAYPLVHSFHLSSEYKAPMVSVVDYGEYKNSRKFTAGAFTSSPNNGGKIKRKKGRITGKNLGGKFHIFTLIWEKEQIIWKINGLTVRKQKKAIPQSPMFLNFFTSAQGKIDDRRFPVSLDIDWVKAYQKKQDEKSKG
ncbi:MAG: family 16 glycosylhydrolase [Bacteroidales bacterium]|nr:family 16 glycosylhydrolase [Bacteroidales bacterium]MCF8338491.1 family 16 glycosylhydrolase [Bacteroidales bacterium]